MLSGKLRGRLAFGFLTLSISSCTQHCGTRPSAAAGLMCKLALLCPTPLLRSNTAPQLQALSLAHAEAVVAVVGAMGAGAAGEAAASEQLLMARQVLAAARRVAHSADAAIWRSLEAAFEAFAAPLVQVGGAPCHASRRRVIKQVAALALCCQPCSPRQGKLAALASCFLFMVRACVPAAEP